MITTSLNAFLSAVSAIIFRITVRPFLYLIGIMSIINHAINPGKRDWWKICKAIVRKKNRYISVIVPK